jgi:hypothetical protein
MSLQTLPHTLNRLPVAASAAVSKPAQQVPATRKQWRNPTIQSRRDQRGEHEAAGTLTPFVCGSAPLFIPNRRVIHDLRIRSRSFHCDYETGIALKDRHRKPVPPIQGAHLLRCLPGIPAASRPPPRAGLCRAFSALCFVFQCRTQCRA